MASHDVYSHQGHTMSGAGVTTELDRRSLFGRLPMPGSVATPPSAERWSLRWGLLSQALSPPPPVVATWSRGAPLAVGCCRRCRPVTNAEITDEPDVLAATARCDDGYGQCGGRHDYHQDRSNHNRCGTSTLTTNNRSNVYNKCCCSSSSSNKFNNYLDANNNDHCNKIILPTTATITSTPSETITPSAAAAATTTTKATMTTPTTTTTTSTTTTSRRSNPNNKLPVFQDDFHNDKILRQEPQQQRRSQGFKSRVDNEYDRLIADYSCGCFDDDNTDTTAATVTTAATRHNLFNRYYIGDTTASTVNRDHRQNDDRDYKTNCHGDEHQQWSMPKKTTSIEAHPAYAAEVCEHRAARITTTTAAATTTRTTHNAKQNDNNYNEIRKNHNNGDEDVNIYLDKSATYNNNKNNNSSSSNNNINNNNNNNSSSSSRNNSSSSCLNNSSCTRKLIKGCCSYRNRRTADDKERERFRGDGYTSLTFSASTNRLLLSLAGVMTLGTILSLADARPPDAEGQSNTKVATHQFMNYTDKQILDYLVNSSRYDHRIRPEEKTKVNVSVLLLSMSSPDESSLKYEIEFLLIQKWIDQRLAYHETGANHTHLNGLLHEGKIWKPDIYFIKHGEFKTPLNPVHMSLRLYPNGTVLYTMRRHMTLVCQGNLQIFPFDNPKCPFAVESMSYEEEQLKIDWSEEDENITRASSLRALNAYLAKNETGYCDKRHTWRGNYSCLRVLLVFTRDKSFYISTVFVPGIVLVTSSFISFWLDINAVPARVMIGVTTMLNFCTTTNSFRSTLPVVSNLTAMNLWDGVCMFFIYASMLEFVIVNYLYRNLGQHQRHRRYSYASSVASKNHPQATPLLAQQNNKHNVYVKGNESTQKTETTTFVVDPPAGEEPNRSFGRFRTVATLFVWLRRPQAISTQLPSKPRLAKAIDYFSRTVFPVLFGMFTFGFFLNYAVIGPLSEANWKLIEY